MHSINSIPRIYIAAVIFFLLFIFYGFDSLFGSSSLDYNRIDTSSEIIVARLSRALSELNSLKAQNEELRDLLGQYMPNSFIANNIYMKAPPLNSEKDSQQSQQISSPYLSHNTEKNAFKEPSLEYELAHRKLQNDINEFWYMVRNNYNSTSGVIVKQLRDSLLFDLGKFSSQILLFSFSYLF